MIDEKLSNGVKLDVNDFIVQWWLENNLEVENRSLEGEFDKIRELAKAGPNSMNSIFSSLKNVGTNRHVLNPPVSASRGRPRGSLNRSTRRDPSGFEHVEEVEGRNRCKRCNGVGHNKRTCMRQ